MSVVALEYIELDDRGVAKLIGSRIKVMHLVMAQQMNILSAEQLCQEYPHLSPAQVYAALSYYHANKAVVDLQIKESRQMSDEMRSKHPNRHTRAEMEQLLLDRGKKAGSNTTE
jgi:uncharacterized protein (DUF433 family)